MEKILAKSVHRIEIFITTLLQCIFFFDKMRVSYGGWVAQLVEQRIENPRVGGSIPSLATI